MRTLRPSVALAVDGLKERQIELFFIFAMRLGEFAPVFNDGADGLRIDREESGDLLFGHPLLVQG